MRDYQYSIESISGRLSQDPLPLMVYRFSTVIRATTMRQYSTLPTLVKVGWWLSLGRGLSQILGSGEASFCWSHLTPRGLGGRTLKSRGPACPIACVLGEHKLKWLLGTRVVPPHLARGAIGSGRPTHLKWCGIRSAELGETHPPSRRVGGWLIFKKTTK